MVSGLVIVSLVSLAVQGLRYDVEFSGGILIQVRFDQAPRIDQVRGALGRIGLAGAIIQRLGDAGEYIVRLPLTAGTAEELSDRVREALGGETSLGSFEIRRMEIVGPQVSHDLPSQAAYSVLLSLAGILL